MKMGGWMQQRNENFMKCEYSENNNGRSTAHTRFGMVSIRCAHLKHSIMCFHMSEVWSRALVVHAFFFDCTHNQSRYAHSNTHTQTHSMTSASQNARTDLPRIEKDRPKRRRCAENYMPNINFHLPSSGDRLIVTFVWASSDIWMRFRQILCDANARLSWHKNELIRFWFSRGAEKGRFQRIEMKLQA